MKRKIGIIILFVVALSMVFIGYKGISMASKYEDETKKVSDKKAELVKKREKLQSQIEDLEKDKKDIMKYIEGLDVQMQELEKEEADIKEHIKNTNKELKKINRQLEKARIKESSQYEIMKKRIKYMYENGSQDYLDIILSSKSVAELLNRAEYINKISKYDENLLVQYKETKEKVEAKEREVSDKLSDLNNLKEELEIQKEAIGTMAQNKEKELRKYEKAIEDTGDQAQVYESEIEEQEKILNNLILQEQKRIQREIQRQLEEQRKREEEVRKQEEASKEKEKEEDADRNNNEDDEEDEENAKTNDTIQIQNTETYSTGFRWPLNVPGTITSNFGPRKSPTAGASSYHQGIDISVPTGTPIVASQTGTVVTASYQSAAGNYVMIHHGDGVFSVYMHCSRLAASKGQSVKKGDVIGYVGSTGISTGPHLHFGISVNGGYVNPLNYVSR